MCSHNQKRIVGGCADGHYVGIIVTPLIIVFILVFVYAGIWQAKRQPFTHPYWSFARWPTHVGKGNTKDNAETIVSLNELRGTELRAPDAAHTERGRNGK
jgi:hypothetical protein